MDKSDIKIVWVDLETTGLDPQRDRILEVGIRITNVSGDTLEWVTSLVWNPDWEVRLTANEVVQKMHTDSGLVVDLAELSRSGQRYMYTPTMVGQQMLGWLMRKLGADAKGTPPMAGNSVHYDRSFLAAYMPDLLGFWHYRNLDMSSMREACRILNPTLFDQMPTPFKAHRPQGDLDESVKLWQWLSDNFFWVE
jgi:oligoribonuclease